MPSELVKRKARRYASESVWSEYTWCELIETLYLYDENISWPQINNIAAMIMATGIDVRDYIKVLKELNS